METLLEQFLNHELVVNVTGATRKEAEEFYSIAKVEWRMFKRGGITFPIIQPMFLHYRGRLSQGFNSITYSSTPIDSLAGNKPMPCVTIKEFLDSMSGNIVEITDDDLDKLFDM